MQGLTDPWTYADKRRAHKIREYLTGEDNQTKHKLNSILQHHFHAGHPATYGQGQDDLPPYQQWSGEGPVAMWLKP